MTTPHAPRRPYRAVGVSPETAFVLTQLRRLIPEFDSIVSRLAQRHLGVEERLRVHDNFEELERHSGDWARWKAFDRGSDVRHADAAGWDMPGGSRHEDSEITTAQAAEALGMSSRQVLRLVEQRVLVGRKVNARATMVTRASVAALKAARAA